MKIIILTASFLLHFQSFAQKLKICMPPHLESPATPADEASRFKEILYKNVYETLFYKEGDQIKDGLASKIEQKAQNQFKVHLKPKVQFQNNNIFFVKKFLTPTDVQFSLEKQKLSGIDKVFIKSEELWIDSKLSLKELYLQLSSVESIIFSAAYHKYLTKRNKLNLFDTSPLGTGPFKIKRDGKTLIAFENYHSQVNLKEIEYLFTDEVLKNACDVFWSFTDFKDKTFQKLGFNFEVEKSPRTLLYFKIYRASPQVKAMVALPIWRDILSFWGAKKLASSNGEKQKISSPLTLCMKPKQFKISQLKTLPKKLRSYLEASATKLRIVSNDSEAKSKLCDFGLYLSDEIDLKEIAAPDIIPVAYFPRKIFYRKKMKNIFVDLVDSIDYSQIYYFK